MARPRATTGDGGHQEPAARGAALGGRHGDGRGAGAYNGAEDKLLAGVQEAWDARPTTLSSDDSNTKQPTAEIGLAPRAALFESFLSSTLRRICPSIARHSMSVIPKHTVLGSDRTALRCVFTK